MSGAFALLDRPIPVADWRARVAHPAAGGVVIFEGVVRDHHRGVAVAALEYTAHAALARRQGADVLAAAAARWPLRACAAAHRTGRLAVGDLAVWVGVAADHRQEAFAACAWIIDALKRRLPIWKREWRPDGAAVWVDGVPLES